MLANSPGLPWHCIVIRALAKVLPAKWSVVRNPVQIAASSLLQNGLTFHAADPFFEERKYINCDCVSVSNVKYQVISNLYV